MHGLHGVMALTKEIPCTSEMQDSSLNRVTYLAAVFRCEAARPPLAFIAKTEPRKVEIPEGDDAITDGICRLIWLRPARGAGHPDVRGIWHLPTET